MMLVFSPRDRGTIMATSTNGTSFQYLGPFPVAGFGTTAPIEDGGGFRMFVFDQRNQTTFRSLSSSNAAAWRVERDIHLRAPPGFEITDPFPLRLADGTWKLFYKRSEAVQRTHGPTLMKPPAYLSP